MVLLICSNWLLCHRPQPDPLFYIGDDSLALLSRLTPRGKRTALDLCAGPGTDLAGLYRRPDRPLARLTASATAARRTPQASRRAGQAPP